MKEKHSGTRQKSEEIKKQGTRKEIMSKGSKEIGKNRQELAMN